MRCARALRRAPLLLLVREPPMRCVRLSVPPLLAPLLLLARPVELGCGRPDARGRVCLSWSCATPVAGAQARLPG